MVEGEANGYEFEPDDLRELLVDQVAKAIFLGNITDDNPSPTNGKTALDQVLEWEFDIEGDEGMQQLKTAILVRVLELRGGCDMSGYEHLTI